MRVLTVSEHIEPGHEILPLEEVYSIIDGHSSFAIIPCPCRLRAGISGVRECTDKYPIERCLRDVRLMRIGGGTDEVMKYIIQKHIYRKAEKIPKFTDEVQFLDKD